MIQSHTATVCALMGVPTPDGLAPALEPVRQLGQSLLQDRPVQKCLVFAPDALGHHLYRRDASLFAPFEAICSMRVAVQAEMPSVTPVCFGSIFTGSSPAEHGIRAYAKPVLACDTLFDYLARAGKRVAIVAVADSSIDRIFRERPIDYFSEADDAEVTARTLALLAADSHDFILVYQQEYDDILHQQTPFSADAIAAVRHHGAAFAEIAAAVEKAWGGYDRLMAVTPDHGAHVDEHGKGDHGLAIAEDLEVNHFYGVFAGRA